MKNIPYKSPLPNKGAAYGLIATDENEESTVPEVASPVPSVAKQEEPSSGRRRTKREREDEAVRNSERYRSGSLRDPYTRADGIKTTKLGLTVTPQFAREWAKFKGEIYGMMDPNEWLMKELQAAMRRHRTRARDDGEQR